MANTIKFYFDEHMPRPVARALVERGVEVIMAIDSEMVGKDDDSEHLPFATENKRSSSLVTGHLPDAQPNVLTMPV
jgi:hypothetical protein